MSKIQIGSKRLPYYFYFCQIVFISLVGFFDSLYLAVSHYRNYADIGYQSFCAISSSINCDTVSQSQFSIFLNIPVPIWGMVAHSFFLVVLFFASPWSDRWQTKWCLLMTLSICYSVYCIILAGISVFIIHSYCIMCILGYAVCFLQLLYSVMIKKRFVKGGGELGFYRNIKHLFHFSRVQIVLSGAFFIIIFVLFLYFPSYWKINAFKLHENIASGITNDGHPWIGSESPELTITEFSDYLCFPCRKNYLYLRRLIQAYPDKIRLIHRHFPMDHAVNPIVKQPYHNGSGKLALLALAAVETGKFWEMNDLLFSIPRSTTSINVKNIAKQAGIDFEELQDVLHGSQLYIRLQGDIKRGIELGLSGTPGFLINGDLYIGQIPAKILENHGFFKKNIVFAR